MFISLCKLISILIFSAAGLEVGFGSGDKTLNIFLMTVNYQNCTENSQNKFRRGNLENKASHNNTHSTGDGRRRYLLGACSNYCKAQHDKQAHLPVNSESYGHTNGNTLTTLKFIYESDRSVMKDHHHIIETPYC